MTEAWIFQINLAHGMPKLATREAMVSEDGLEGDGQRHRNIHGGKERAVCLYSLERILALQEEGHPLYPGAMGENLTITGLDWERIVPGARLKLGDEVQMEITSYTAPCSGVQKYFKEGLFTRASQKKYPGWARVYARVLHPGHIQVGDHAALLEQD